MKNTYVNQSPVINITGGVETLYAPVNLKRRAIVMSPPNVGTLYISFNRPAVQFTGLVIPSGYPSVILDVDTVGNAITEEIRCFNATGSVASYVEFMDG